MSKVPKIGSLSQCHRYFMGDKSCLFFLVSLYNQTVEMFCLSNVIQKLNSNYVHRSCHLCCFCSKLMFFKRRRVIYSSNSTYAHQTNQKKNCIRPCDTNNSSQSLTRMYRHTATENIHRLNGAKISRPPPQQECPINLTLFVFQFACNARFPDHQFVLFFSHEV